VTINERDARGINVGLSAHVELDAIPGKSYTGQVVRIAPSFDPVTRTLEAEVQLDNSAGELRPGMYGRGAVRLEMHPQVPVVSVNALQISENQKYVYLLMGTKVTRRTGGNRRPRRQSVLRVTQGLAGAGRHRGGRRTVGGSSVRATREIDPYSGARAAVPSAAPSTSSTGPVRN
jgi:multidrug efflux pump subunit AcrA (membrane-fusion protein)